MNSEPIVNKRYNKRANERPFHNNNLIQLIIKNIEIQNTQKFFETNLVIGIQRICVENCNCHQFDLKQGIMKMCSKLMSTDQGLLQREEEPEVGQVQEGEF